jgi:hypothetical protein
MLQQATMSIYSLSSATGGKEDFFTKLRSLNPLAITASGMQRNAGEALAYLTGGDFYRFDGERQFEDRITEIASHIRNRYSLTFKAEQSGAWLSFPPDRCEFLQGERGSKQDGLLGTPHRSSSCWWWPAMTVGVSYARLLFCAGPVTNGSGLCTSYGF